MMHGQKNIHYEVFRRMVGLKRDDRSGRFRTVC